MPIKKEHHRQMLFLYSSSAWQLKESSHDKCRKLRVLMLSSAGHILFLCYSNKKNI